MNQTIPGLRLLALSLTLLGGCAKKDESTAKTAGVKVGEAVTDFALGVGNAIDKKMTVKTELAPALLETGLSTTIAKRIDPVGANRKKGISVYFIAQKSVSGKMIAKALTEKDVEIGRAISEVQIGGDEAKYIQFLFEDDMDTQLVAKYIIDFKVGSTQ